MAIGTGKSGISRIVGCKLHSIESYLISVFMEDYFMDFRAVSLLQRSPPALMRLIVRLSTNLPLFPLRGGEVSLETPDFFASSSGSAASVAAAGFARTDAGGSGSNRDRAVWI